MSIFTRNMPKNNNLTMYYIVRGQYSCAMYTHTFLCQPNCYVAICGCLCGYIYIYVDMNEYFGIRIFVCI